MFGKIVDNVRAKRAQVWADRIDLDGLVSFLRAQHPQKTAEDVSARTGHSIATVRKWLSREVTPNGVAITALYLTYGPELLHAVVRGAPAWLSAAVRDAQMRDLEARSAEQQARLAELERS